MHTAHFPRSTVPGGIRGWAPGAAGLHTGPACGAGTGTVLQSGSCLLCKQKHRMRMSQNTCPVRVAKPSLPSCWESPTLPLHTVHPFMVSLAPFPGRSQGGKCRGDASSGLCLLSTQLLSQTRPDFSGWDKNVFPCSGFLLLNKNS